MPKNEPQTKCKAIKTSGENLSEFGLGKDFLHMTPKAPSMKETQISLHLNEILCKDAVKIERQATN